MLSPEVRRSYLRLVLLGAVIGIPASVVAAGFLAIVHHIEHWLWTDLPDALGGSAPQWYLVIGLPVVGAAVVLAARTLLPGDGGHSPLDGVAGGPTPLAAVPGVAIAAIGSLSFGAVLGPEAPLIALGSVAGLIIARYVTLGVHGERALDAAGAFAAISALFGGPIVGGVFMVEGSVGLGAAVIPVVLPGFVAAAVGYLVFVGIGSWGGVGAEALFVPNLPLYDGTHVLDLLLAIAVGVGTGLLVAVVRHLARHLDGGTVKRLGSPVMLLVGAAAVGLLAEAADLLGADSQDVLFSGQASIPALVGENSTKIVLILLVAKGLAYAICLGCGFRGGPVFPAIFLGVGLAALGIIAFDVSPTLALAIGAAAGVAAMTRLLLTSVLLATLLVGSAGLDAVPAAVLAAVAAWLTITSLDARAATRAAVDVVVDAPAH
jgi:H+/Cl- antiporter ClcA